MVRITVFATMVLLAAAMAAARPLDLPGVESYADMVTIRAVEQGSGRTLLAQSDAPFNDAQRAFPGKSIMVCKDCNAYGLTGLAADYESGAFHVWAFNTGEFSNQACPLFHRSSL
ncbi:hypothetical protein COCSUDRAFT_45290 [Coccomyxa subellipsoidea C-169]|uniref:Uncharacterized protein n=1 Tax=Coccomyxa subellipsoidea (strain C-169) TaxID=574566 RepID=I0YJC6_COCSC|nr:hypothetical protein COCSUDRAFT_45290 [Coccomyxa subellipsoidea C-169]EIE18495.1 hypothetical protein COCSUDRAFT_45290 [Coccomyxa subellipsoidea C-169]|eukprot:XP_005643039.1 hypothetical protein COCSUDRAFT_45290 [Coccomyxa subellipsoidea C-169]